MPPGVASHDGKGLTLPSQIHYLHYYEKLRAAQYALGPRPRKLVALRLRGGPEGMRPAVTVSNHDGTLCTRRPGAGQPKLWHELGGGAVELGLGVAVEGDFKVRFHHRDGDFYCWLHTALLLGPVKSVPTTMQKSHKKWVVGLFTFLVCILMRTGLPGG